MVFSYVWNIVNGDVSIVIFFVYLDNLFKIVVILNVFNFM